MSVVTFLCHTKHQTFAAHLLNKKNTHSAFSYYFLKKFAAMLVSNVRKLTLPHIPKQLNNYQLFIKKKIPFFEKCEKVT
jgi:hypothetical protein